MSKESQLSRRQFFQVAGVAGLAAGLPSEWLRYSEELGRDQWPRIGKDQLPEAMRSVQTVCEMVPEVEINELGYLEGKTTEFKAENEAPAGDERFGAVGDELTDEFYGQKISWIVLLQKKSEDPVDRVERPVVDSHFEIDGEKITQTFTPSKAGRPRVVSQVRVINRENSNRYASLMRGLSLSKEYQGEFSPVLKRVFYEEPIIPCFRRSIVVEVGGGQKEGSKDVSQEAKANLLAVMRSLRKYGIGPWDAVDNSELYERFSDIKKDLGVKTMVELRYLWGVKALMEGDRGEMELVFGDFVKEGESKLEAVKRYFEVNRKYLSSIFMPKEMQKWDAKTKYWYLMDVLKGEEMPIADEFVMPVDKDSRGGARFLEPETNLYDHSKKTGDFHLGYDFNIGSANEDEGMPFKCIANGKVVWTGWTTNGLGKTAIVRHRLPDGREVYSRYGHTKDLYVNKEDKVQVGQEIGTIGRTGHEDLKIFKAHLHLDIALADTYGKVLRKDPANYDASKSKEMARQMFVDPIEFIEQNHSLGQETEAEDLNEISEEWDKLSALVE